MMVRNFQTKVFALQIVFRKYFQTFYNKFSANYKGRRVLQMQMSTLFCCKKLGLFFEIYRVSARQGGEFSQCR